MLRTAAGLRWQARAWLLVAMLVSAVSVPAVESDQFYFIGFEAPLGSISQTGQAQSGVLLRWDTLEGELPPDLQSFELSRDGELLATLPASGHMSVAEIAALYALPQSERLRLEAMRWLSEETPDTPVDAGNLAGVLVDRVLASVPRARLSSRIDPNIAVARYRGFRDQPPGLGTFSYTLIGRLADGGTVALGTLDIEVDGISDALAAGQDLAQVQMRRCDAPEAAKDHGGVALNWRHPGANPIEHYAWSLRIAGYDLYRTSSDIDAPPMPLDLRALAASTAHDPAGRIALAGLEKVNDQPIIVAGSATQQSQYQGFNPAFAQFFETHAELLQAGVQPGGRRGYYLVARDQSGNWGDTAVLDVSVPDLSAPPAPWNVRVLPSRATGDVRLMWPQVSVLNYFPVHQAGRQYCNLASADVDGRLDFVYDGETCDQGRTQSVDLEVAEYRVYRFTNSRQALDFVDGDGDGFHDDDERLGLADPGTACDPELPDPDLSPLSNHLLASVDASDVVIRDGGQAVLEFADSLPAVDVGTNYWYRVAAVDPQGNVGPLSQPVRGLIPDREGPARGDLIGGLVFGKPACSYAIQPLGVPHQGNRFAVDGSESEIATLARLRCAGTPAAGPGVWGPEKLRLPAPLYLPIEEHAGERRAELSLAQCAAMGQPPSGCVSGILFLDYLDRFGRTLASIDYPSGMTSCPPLATRLVEHCEQPKIVDVFDGEVIPESEGPILDPANLQQCVRVYRDLGERRLRLSTLCPGDEPLSFDLPYAGGDPICIAVAALDDNAQLSTQYNLPCFRRPSTPLPPSPVAIEFDAGSSQARLRFAYSDLPADGVLLEWSRAGDPDTRQVRFVARPPAQAAGEAVTVAIDVGAEPLGADWREQWCFKGLSIGGEGLSGSSPGSSDWSETVCDDRTPASSDPPVYLPWPRIPVPEAGDQLQAQYARSDDIGVVLLSEPMDSTQSSCLPEPPPIACDLQFPPSSSGLGRCVGEIGHPPQPTYARCALCSVIQQHANVPLRFVAYRQSRAGPSEAPGDFYQISPLLDAPWCDLEVNAFGSVTRLNDPWFSLVNVATGNEWPGYRLLFTDRFPFRDDRQLRYKFVLFDERGEIAGHRLSNWITPQ